MDKYWLEARNESGITEKLPKGVLNYANLKSGESLPRIGERLEIMVNVESNGANEGHFNFRVIDIANFVHQSTDTKTPQSNLGYPKVYVQYLGELTGSRSRD
jgi:hypothetical protein